MMILLLGPTGTGKSTLLKLLMQDSKQKTSKSDFVELPATVPTVGTNINNINLGKRSHIEIRELGGSMAPLWKSYFGDAKGIIFVIDVSNSQQVSVASIQLQGVLTCGLPTLVILNKADVLSVTSINEMKYLLRLSRLLSSCSNFMSVVEVSCNDKTGFQDIFKWLRSL